MQIKDFNVIINNQPIKNKQGTCEKHVEVLRNNGYTTGNLLDCLYHQNYDKLIGTNLEIRRI